MSVDTPSDDLAAALQLARGQACDDRQLALAEVERLLFGRSAVSMVGRYRIRERLGTGGQGTVWRAYDPQLDRDVAVKLIHRTAARFSHGDDRLLREARALARVSHPNVLQVLDVGVHDERVFMVTAFAGGPDARRWLEARPRTTRERAAVVRDMGRGLLAVHALGLLHRDVKPANVFVTPEGRALLGDFGLARPWIRAPTESLEITPASAADVLVTDASVCLGTPAYLAPEQHLGAPASEATDRYALCVAAWEILGGARPFDGASLAELVQAKQRGVAIAPRHGDLPRAVASVLRRGLAPDPAHRHASTHALVVALERAMQPRRIRAGAIAGVAIAALFALPSASSGTAADPCDEAAVSWTVGSHARTPDPGPAGTALAADLSARVDAYMDELGPEWTAASCEAARRLAQGGDDPVAQAELECLLALREDLLGAIEIHRRAGDRGVEGMLSSLVVLGRPAGCRDAGHRPRPTPEHGAAVAEARQRLASSRAHSRTGDRDAALADIDAAAAIADAIAFDPLHAEVALARGRELRVRDDIDGAAQAFERAYERALASRHDVVAADAALEQAHLLASARDDPERATTWLRQTDAALQRIVGTHDHDALAGRLAAVRSKLAGIAGDWTTAHELAQQAVAQLRRIGGHEMVLATATSYAAEAAQRLDRIEQAKASYRDVLAIYERRLGPHHPQTAMALGNLAAAHVSANEMAEAVPLLRRSIAIREAALGPGDLEGGNAWVTLSTALRMQGELAHAEAAAERALAIFRERVGPMDRRIALAARAHGDVAFARGDWAAAEARYGVAVEQYEALERRDGLAWSLHKRGLARVELGRVAAAIADHRRALALRERTQGGDAIEVAYSVLQLAAAHQAGHEGRVALALAERGEAIARGHDEPILVALALQRQGRILGELRRIGPARAALERAIEVLEAADEPAAIRVITLELAALAEAAGDAPAAAAAIQSARTHVAAPPNPEFTELAQALALDRSPAGGTGQRVRP